MSHGSIIPLRTVDHGSNKTVRYLTWFIGGEELDWRSVGDKPGHFNLLPWYSEVALKVQVSI